MRVNKPLGQFRMVVPALDSIGRADRLQRCQWISPYLFMVPRTRKNAVANITKDAAMENSENIGNGEAAAVPAIQV